MAIAVGGGGGAIFFGGRTRRLELGDLALEGGDAVLGLGILDFDAL